MSRVAGGTAVTSDELQELLRLRVHRHCAAIAGPFRQRSEEVQADHARRGMLLGSHHWTTQLDALRDEANSFAEHLLADLLELTDVGICRRYFPSYLNDTFNFAR